MIQRIQSVLLFLSAACFGALFAVPFASGNGNDLFADKIYNIQDNIGLMVIAGLGAALCLGAILVFKNRVLQKRMSLLTSILAIGLIGLAVYLLLPHINSAESQNQLSYKLGIGLPVLSLMFSFLASRFIQKDENLVQSMDRLR